MARSRVAALTLVFLAMAAFCTLQTAFVGPRGAPTAAPRGMALQQQAIPKDFAERYPWSEVPKDGQRPWWLADSSYVGGFTMLFFVSHGFNVLGFYD
mmetsp:Transcript_70579/g.97808  ORF Transcript_70579/g.97808 Transcript_70579/m.97808 type:complete len:97 (+) Transcript_70579:85-375(+)